MSKVLVVDDDPTILRTLRINLRARGHDVEAVTNGREALSAFAETSPDIVVLDLGLPDIDGVDVLRRIRRQSRTPIIVLTARHDSDDKVEALDEGADDYVTKPFGMDEFMARIRAALRRGASSLPSTAPFACDDFTLDFDERVCTVRAVTVHLTPTEWRLLAELARHDERIVPHDRLLQAAWGPSYGRESNYLRVYASQLRRKLEPDPSHPVHIVTEPGVGYRLVR